jgi:hypothetical protein
MTIYQDSKRIVGTNADRVGADAISGGWKLLDRTTLGSAGDTISVSSLPDKRYYMILGHIKNTGGDTVSHLRANSDANSNYATRVAVNGATPHTTSAPDNRFCTTHNSKSIDSRFIQGYIANKSDEEKLGIFHINENPSIGTSAPSRIECVGKHVQTTNPINELRLFNDEAGSFDTGGELVVLGYDPDDTHTTNFWEELVDASGSGASFNTGTFTAKKYLWIQCWYKATGGGLNVGLQVGNNTISSSSGNYTYRTNQNGTSDSTNTTANNIVLDSATTDSGETGFANIFVVNNSSDEKLFIISQTSVVATGGTAPNRRETVAKFVNTTNQINIVGLYDAGTGGSFTSSSFIKVWGAD